MGTVAAVELLSRFSTCLVPVTTDGAGETVEVDLDDQDWLVLMEWQSVVDFAVKKDRVSFISALTLPFRSNKYLRKY